MKLIRTFKKHVNDDHQLHEINENVSTVNHNLNANATKASVWYKSNLLKGPGGGGGGTAMYGLYRYELL